MEKLDLNELTLEELKVEAVKLGMPKESMDAFKNKSPLIATINTLKTKDADKVAEVKKVKTLNPPETPIQKRADNKSWLTKAERMRDKLDKQKKIRVLLPLEGKEKPGVVKVVKIKGRKEYVHVSGAIETVTMNGCKTIIPKGVYFDVAEQVAEIISDSYKQTQEAGREFLLDRESSEAGKTVRESM